MIKNLFSVFKNDVIEFLCEPDDMDVIKAPIQAGKRMPDWYKKIPTHCRSGSSDQFGGPAATAKKCMPMIDGMNLGFIIPLWGDVNIRTNGDGKLIEASKNPYGGIVEFHSNEQLGGATSPTKGAPAIKFINRWVIKTAPGWSTLFITPMNHMDKRFTCLGALVDTDTYPKHINFPAVWHLPNFDGIIEAGTPLVTAIPVRRKDMEHPLINRVMTEDERTEINRIERMQNSRGSVYTNELREKR
jgi:hypothetical protein